MKQKDKEWCTYRTRIGHGRRVITQEEETTAQQVSQTRTGIRDKDAIPETIRTSIGDRVVSVAFVPFIRSRTISFSATRLNLIQEFILSLII